MNQAKIIECLYLFCPLIFYFISIIKVFGQFSLLSKSTNVIFNPYINILNTISNNLQLSPINDIVLYNATTDSCPNNYYLVYIDKWPGSLPGCYDGSSGQFLVDFCPENSGVNQKNLEPTRPQSLILWGNSSFCISRLSNTTRNETCPNDYINCGNGYCIPNDSVNCPIIDIQITNEPNNYVNYSRFQLQNGNYIVYSTNSTKGSNLSNSKLMPIINISASIGSLPCLDSYTFPNNQYYNFTLIYPNLYPSINKKSENKHHTITGCSSYGIDNDFTVPFGTQSLREFYKDNKMIDVLNGLGNFWDNIEDLNMIFYSKKLMNVENNSFCYSFNPRYLVNQLRNFEVCTEFVVCLMIFSILCHILIGVNVVFLVIDSEEKNHIRFIKEKKCLFNSFHFFIYVMCILFLCEIQRLPKDQISITQDLIPYIKETIQQGCFKDSILVEFMQDLQGKIEHLNGNFYNQTDYLSNLGLIFLILFILLRTYRGYYIKEVNQLEDSFLELMFIRQNMRRINIIEDARNLHVRVSEEEGGLI